MRLYVVAMTKPATNREAYAAVIAKVPASKLARYLGLTRQAVSNWGGVVPDRYVLQVSVITGIPPEHILPELVVQVRGYVKHLRDAEKAA